MGASRPTLSRLKIWVSGIGERVVRRGTAGLRDELERLARRVDAAEETVMSLAASLTTLQDGVGRLIESIPVAAQSSIEAMQRLEHFHFEWR